MWNKDYFKQRYEKRLIEATEYLGRECRNCGSKENLEFDHIDPSTKIESISRMTRLSKEKFWAEVKKCQLLCKDCHIAKTAQEQSLERKQETKHGTIYAYQSRGCRCEACKKAKADYRKKNKDGIRLDEGIVC